MKACLLEISRRKPFKLNVWAHPPVVAPPDASQNLTLGCLQEKMCIYVKFQIGGFLVSSRHIFM